MADAFEIRNNASDSLCVWVEPWCHPYYLPRGACLKLSYDQRFEHPPQIEVTPETLVVWSNSKQAPSAELDGNPVEPDFT